MRIVNVVMTCKPAPALFSHPFVELRNGVQYFGDSWTAVYFPTTGKAKLFSRSLDPPPAVEDCRVDLIVAVASVRRAQEEELVEALRAAGLSADRPERSPALLAYGAGYTLRIYPNGKVIVFARTAEALTAAEGLLRRL